MKNEKLLIHLSARIKELASDEEKLRLYILKVKNPILREKLYALRRLVVASRDCLLEELNELAKE